MRFPIFLFSLLVIHASIYSGELDKYLKPANLTILDWKLMQAQTENLSNLRRYSWDKNGLINSVVTYRKDGKLKIGMTFTIDKQTYLNLQKDIIKKTLIEAVKSTFKVISPYIPEAKLEDDVFANFSVIEGDIIGHFQYGVLHFDE